MSFVFFLICTTPKEFLLSKPENELEVTKVHLGMGSACARRGGPGHCSRRWHTSRGGPCFQGVLLEAPEGLDLQRFISSLKNPEDIWQNVKLC